MEAHWPNCGLATSSVAHCEHSGRISDLTRHLLHTARILESSRTARFDGQNVTFLHYFTFDPLDPPLHFRHCVNRYGTPDALYGIRVPLIDPTASAATVPLLMLRFFDALVQTRRFTSLVISFRFQIRLSQPP